ncbi:hypothetical protein ACMGD3_24005 [Lysinibacillus sphaericus]
MEKGSNNKKIDEIEEILLITSCVIVCSLFLFVFLEPNKYFEFISGIFK